MHTFELTKKYTLRNQLAVHTEVIDNVKPISFLPVLDVVTIQQAADYFEVSAEQISKICTKFKSEFHADGAGLKRPSEFAVTGLLRTFGTNRGKTCFKMDDGTILEINNCGAYCLTRPALLRLAMLLSDSLTAEAIRNELSAFAEETVPSNAPDNQLDQMDSPPPAELKPNEDVQTFNNPEFGTVRTLNINGEPWFIGKDVAEILGYSNPSKAVMNHVDSEDKQLIMMKVSDSQNGNLVKTALINESGLYSLILSSKLPSAKSFKRWVTSEILPSIRKHGAYMTPDTIEKVLLNPDTIIKIATQLKQEQEKNYALTLENQKLEEINRLLADGINTWDNKAMLNAMVRAAAGRYNDDFRRAWNTYYRRLSYKNGIVLKTRSGDGNMIDKIRTDEWNAALQVAAAWLVELHINVESIINMTNTANIQC